MTGLSRVGLVAALMFALSVGSASAAGTPGTASTSNTSSGLGCGFLYEQRSAAFLEPNLKFGLQPDVHYGLSIRYCIEKYAVPKIIYADIDINTKYPKSNLNALSRTIGEFFLSIRHRWRAAKQKKALITNSEDRVRVRASTGHFDLCVIPLPGIAGRLAKGAGRGLKRLPRSWRRKVVNAVVSKPTKAAINRTLIAIRTAERKVIERKLRQGGMTKKQARSASLEEAKKRLAQRKSLYFGLIEIMADSFIDLKFAEVCVKAWQPQLTAVIPRHGHPRMEIRNVSGRLGSSVLAHDWRTGYVNAPPNPRGPIGPGET